MHTFGCPCFVLQDKLRTGLDKLPRWEPRSTKGIFLGKSQHHANSASIVLNLDTGRVTTQQHIVFDDHFSTVAPTCDMNEIWPELLSKRTQRATFDIPIEISEGTANKQADQSPVPINVSEGTIDKQAKQADRSYEARQTKSGRPSRHPK